MENQDGQARLSHGTVESSVFIIHVVRGRGVRAGRTRAGARERIPRDRHSWQAFRRNACVLQSNVSQVVEIPAGYLYIPASSSETPAGDQERE